MNYLLLFSLVAGVIFGLPPCHARRPVCRAKVVRSVSPTDNNYLVLTSGTFIDAISFMKKNKFTQALYLCQSKRRCFPMNVYEGIPTDRVVPTLPSLRLLTCHMGILRAQDNEFDYYRLDPNLPRLYQPLKPTP